jgi:dihydroneopterin aldolase
VKVGLWPGAEKQRALLRALVTVAGRVRIFGVVFADRERDLLRLLPEAAGAGFAGMMLDTDDKSAGRLITHAPVAALSAFVRSAREFGLEVGLAGGLEQPDIPRLLALEPDFLGFRGALCRGGARDKAIDLNAVRAIRRLIPPTEQTEAKVDYSLLSARGYHPESAGPDNPARVFVRDYVVPVRIGAYSHEREKPQKVRFDVSVEIDRARGEPHGMGQVFSYDLITDAISAIVAEGHVDFVETLAERLGARVLREPRARRVTVKVEKLELGPGAVGVELVMEQPAATAAENPVLAMLDDYRKPH